MPRAFWSFTELEELDLSHNHLGSPHEMSSHYLVFLKSKLKKVPIVNSYLIGFLLTFSLFWFLWNVTVHPETTGLDMLYFRLQFPKCIVAKSTRLIPSRILSFASLFCIFVSILL